MYCCLAHQSLFLQCTSVKFERELSGTVPVSEKAQPAIQSVHSQVQSGALYHQAVLMVICQAGH